MQTQLDSRQGRKDTCAMLAGQPVPHPDNGNCTDSKGLVTFDYSSVRTRKLLDDGSGGKALASSGKVTVWKEGKRMGQISEPLYH
eukprot:3599372-Rhodomonas_salina.1